MGDKPSEPNQHMKKQVAALEAFSNPTHTWRQQNDPVMGGRSTGNFTIKDGIGYFVGHVAIVPSLKAPGFIKVSSEDRKPFPDVRSCSALEFTVRTKDNSFTGYRVSFGTKQPPIHKFFAYGFKAHFNAPVGEEFTTVEIPFTNFSDYWDDATGKQIKTCQDNVIYCPDQETLKDMKTISFWAEGVEGDVYLEIKSIAATGCKGGVISLMGDKPSEPNQHMKKQVAALEAFSNPTHTWRQQNDPVMGGRSTGNFTIKDGIGYFVGHVAIVPSLKAPGFIKVSSEDRKPFPDVRSCSALEFTVRTKDNSFTGYRVSFGTKQPPIHKFFAYGFKAHFNAPVGEEFTTVEIPFTNFSDYWDDATGKQIKTCQDNVIYCPDQETLKDMKTISFWAEGVEGDVYLEIKSIAATGCKGGVISLMGDKPSEPNQHMKKQDAALEAFSNPTHTWRQQNDPVMGGRSTGNFTIKDGIGYFVGHVAIVPSLKAPGFIKVSSEDRKPFPDVRSCSALEFTVRTKDNSFTGYRVSFGTKQPPIHKFFAYGFKAHFNAPVGEEFTTVEIPFTNFSDY
jgi:Pyruvate/2-oxoacid:ferredoxin oxidoreductase delta subunit